MNRATPAQLFQTGNIPATPFEMDMGSGSPLVVEAMLRVLPGKRLVMKARRENIVLLVKIFREQHSYKKEMAGYDLLGSAGIATPVCLERGKLKLGGYYCFYEYCENLLSLKSALDKAVQDEKPRHLHQLLTLLDTMYRGGVYQQDLHLDNFAYAGDTLLALDPASCTTTSEAAAQTENLALLLAQLPLKDWPVAIDMITQQFPGLEVNALESAGWQRWKKRLQIFLKKIYRECTYVKCWSRKLGLLQQLDIYCVRQDCSESMRTMLESINIPPPEAEYLKRGLSSQVYTVAIEGRQQVIKHSRNKTIGRLLRRCLRRTRASNAWYFSHMLLESGIAVPRPVALVEKKWGPFNIESWFVSEYIEGESLLDVWLYVPPEDWQLSGIKEFFVIMERLQISHGDLKATNILCHDDKLLIIDFDGASEYHCRQSALRALTRDKKRFLQNWDNKILQHKLAEVLYP